MKVSISVILGITICLIISKLLMKIGFDAELLTYFVIIIPLVIGLFVAYKANKESIRLNFNKKNKKNTIRIFNKFLSFNLILIGCLLFTYFMVHTLNNSLYLFFYADFFFFYPILLIIGYCWIDFIDRRQENPEDDYYYIIQDIREKKFLLKKYKNFLLIQLVRIFYIPFIYGASFSIILKILNFDLNILNIQNLVLYLIILGNCFDVIIGFGGYIFSSKYFSTETISVDDTWSGWLVCLICYPPLIILFQFFIQQVDNYTWTDWLNVNDPLYWLWAIAICISWMCYWFSTMSFGFRFSNLSWRGLVDTGLYRYVKHPAYLSKNIYWWLSTVPFFGVYGFDLIRNICALSLLSLVYYFRAKTEERHLMKFQEYREYSELIARNGLWSKIKKVLN